MTSDNPACQKLSSCFKLKTENVKIMCHFKCFISRGKIILSLKDSPSYSRIIPTWRVTESLSWMGFLLVKLRSAHSLVNEISVNIKEADSAVLLVHPNSLLLSHFGEWFEASCQYSTYRPYDYWAKIWNMATLN